MNTILFFSVLGLVVLIIALSSIKIIHQSEVGMVERLGKFNRQIEAGVNFIIPFIDRVSEVIDLRTQVMDSEPQAVITKDNVGMEIDTVLYYKVTDAFKSVYEIEDLETAILNITATTLRDVIGSMELDETLQSRDTINAKLRIELDKATDAWGVRVERVEVRDILPPDSITQAMESQMKAERERRALVTAASGNKEAAILNAEGQKQSAILKAQAEKETTVLDAQGKAEAIERIASARQLEIGLVYKALKDANLDEAVLKLESINALKEMAKSDNKMLVPYESQQLMGTLASLGFLKENNK